MISRCWITTWIWVLQQYKMEMGMPSSSSSSVLPVTSRKTHHRLKHILDYFPTESTLYVFGYGSGVFPQNNQNQDGKMIDLIFVVNDPMEWHKQNLELNWSHYSNVRLFGAYSITILQERLGCGVYYNTYAQIDNLVVKYGVISESAFSMDLVDWSFIYIAGRLHKPVLTLKQPSDVNNNYLSSILAKNRLSALRIALLQLPEVITTEQLYLTITELSYLGDYRMSVAENPNKVKNIVIPLMKEFDEIYLKLLKKFGGELVMVKPDGILYQKTDPAARLRHLLALPFTVQQSLVAALKRTESAGIRCAELSIIPMVYDDIEVHEAMIELSQLSNISMIIRNSIRNIVMIASIRQTLTGFLSTGLFNSLYYAYDKFMKSNAIHQSEEEEEEEEKSKR